MRKEKQIISVQYRTNFFGNLVVWVRVVYVYIHPIMLDESPDFDIWRTAKDEDRAAIRQFLGQQNAGK